MPFCTHYYSKIDRKKLRRLRLSGVDGKALPKTKVQLAAELGVSNTTIQKLEDVDSRIPSIELIIRYCEYFKIPFAEVLIPEERSKFGAMMADFFFSKDIIDYGTAQLIKSYYNMK